MKSITAAGLCGIACLGAHAQAPSISRTPEPLVVTATRGLYGGVATMRDTVVITREELEDAGSLSLAEALQRFAGAEIRATGGPGQPTGIFLRGAGTAQTLVLVDGLRVGSATAGTTAIEAIPLEMIERIEVVKGPMSSLWGSDAIGGVVQVFTRGRSVPHLFGAAAYGTDNDRRVSAGLSTVERGSAVSLSLGARKVDAPSATTPRVPFAELIHDPDRDPHENAFATLRASHTLWQGEKLELEAFGSRSKTRFDGGSPLDESRQTVAGARVTSSAQFTRYWLSKLSFGTGRDKLAFDGAFAGTFETRQDQAAWINDFRTRSGSLVAGVETLRQRVLGDTPYARTARDTNSAFLSANETWRGQRMEASLRRDDEEQFGKRDTGSVSYGWEMRPKLLLSLTFAKGFRAPTFNDLYYPFGANPDLRPERSDSRELSLKTLPGRPWQWRLTAFDNRLEDLIVYRGAVERVENVDRARVRGLEASAEGTALGLRWRGSLTLQRPRDEESGARLQGRAERFASLDVGKTVGRWSGALGVVASGDRFDSPGADPATRMAGYTRLDARIGYRFEKFWSVEVSAVNLTDRRYETALGYEAPRRGVFARVRFDAF